MSQDKHESFWIEWKDPADDLNKYFALSPETGHYWTVDPNDTNIVDGSELDFAYEPEDTIKQISEKWKLKKGTGYERFNLFKHPSEHAWLSVEKKPTGERDEDNKVIRAYKAFWSRKFKSVVCISRITGQRQGNPSLQDKEYARNNSAKAKAERKKRLENIEKASKRLNFNPAEQLIAWAMGDDSKLNTKQPITNAQRIKSLEILASYSFAKPKPYDEQLALKNKERSGPSINVILPADGSEVKGKVLEHKSEEALQEYLKNGSKDVFVDYNGETDAGEYSYSSARFELPDEEDD